MHRYLRAIGFSNLENRFEINKIITYIVHNADERKYINKNESDIMLTEYSKEFSSRLGIKVCGELNEKNEFCLSYYYPYLLGTLISSYEDITIERHAEKESYAGICDDIKIGVSLIFYLQNMIPYLKIRNAEKLPAKGTSLILSALSVKGIILMPIKKSERDIRKVSKKSMNRYRMLERAKVGDEEAIEKLTLEDLDVYANVSKKLKAHDIYSLVDSYFMPYGLECDQYAVMGEIIDFHYTHNTFTDEQLCIMTINCNDLYFDVSINVLDLVGKPEIGRRFKGNIWMQGYINFPQ